MKRRLHSIHRHDRRSRRRRWALLAALLLGAPTSGLLAQSLDPVLSAPPDGIDLVARREGDSIVLRWTPMNPRTWRRGQLTGYRVIRSVGADPVRVAPFLEPQWRDFARTSDVAAAIVKVLYDTASTSASQSTDDRIQFEMTPDDARYGAAMLMAASDSRIANGLALRWVDPSPPSSECEYCVELESPAAAPIRACTRVGIAQAAPVPIPAQLTALRDGASIVLSWIAPADPELLGFVVDRIDETTGSGLRLTRAPLLVTVLSDEETEHRGLLRDTAVVAGRRYRYEVRCINGFGQLGTPATIGVQYRAETLLPKAPTPALRQLGHCALEVLWEPPSDANLCVRLERSRTLFEGYEPVGTLCGGSPARLIDSTASRKYSYYRTVVLDAEGNEQASQGIHFTFSDSLPPTPPVNLRGVIDDRGAVRMAWTAPPECDVRGYHVFWTNHPEHEFVPRTRSIVGSTEFLDTVNIETLTRYVYYRVVAVDYTGLPSQWSQTLELERPDHLRPLAPVILNASPEADGVRIRWAPSQSADVQRQLLLRAEDGGPLEPRRVLPASVASVLDSNCRPGRRYTYAVVAEDSSGNRSPQTGALEVTLPEPKSRARIAAITGEYDPSRRAVRLHWVVDGPMAPDDWIIVLRSTRGTPLSPLTTAGPDKNELLDEDLRSPGEYTYALQIASGQWRSDVSARATVAVP